MNKFSSSPKGSENRFNFLSGSNLLEMEIIDEASFSHESDRKKSYRSKPETSL